MLDDVRYIAIEGPIGAGKTSLAHALAERLGARLVLEPADDNPFLEKFYADMPAYALATQLAFLALRHRQQTELARRDLSGPKVVSDYIVARDKIFAGLTLDEEELGLYGRLYAAMAARAPKPDIVVLLEADAETLMSRIYSRGTPYEDALSRGYIERLVAEYDAYFRFYDETPLLVIDTGLLGDYSEAGIDPDEVIGEIEQTGDGRRVYVPDRGQGSGGRGNGDI
ncbi:MAG: deoxynucleoside kinase [Planctomycetota bacterium]